MSIGSRPKEPRFCPPSLEVDRRRISNGVCSDSGDSEEDIDRTISIILGKCKDIICAKNKKKPIGKKINSFACEQGVVFVCTSGLSSPATSLRDTLQESTMEKLLRLMLKKKSYNQNPCEASSSTKKFLEDKQKPESQNNQDETQE